MLTGYHQILDHMSRRHPDPSAKLAEPPPTPAPLPLAVSNPSDAISDDESDDESPKKPIVAAPAYDSPGIVGFRR